jgi:hypothetical protein
MRKLKRTLEMQQSEPRISQLVHLQDMAKRIESRALELDLKLPAYISSILFASLQEALDLERERHARLPGGPADNTP